MLHIRACIISRLNRPRGKNLRTKKIRKWLNPVGTHNCPAFGDPHTLTWLIVNLVVNGPEDERGTFRRNTGNNIQNYVAS